MIYSNGETRPKLLIRTVRFLGPQALLTWVLLLTALGAMIGGFVDVIAGLEFRYAFVVAFVGMSTGWILGMFPLPGWAGAALGLVIGLEYLLLRVGRLGGAVLDIFRAGFGLLGDLLAWSWDFSRYISSFPAWAEPFEPRRAIDWMAVPEAFLALWRGMGTLLMRAFTWLREVLAAGGAFDPVGSALVWGLVIWVCAMWAGWIVSRKKHPLLAVLPMGSLLSFILAYTWARPSVLLPLLGITLILMALVKQRARESRWNRTGVDFSRDLWGEIAMVATGIALALVVLSAIAPSLTIRKIADWIDELTASEEPRGEQVAESLGLEQQPPPPRPARPAELVRTTDLPRRHLIGSGPELSRIVVMVVRTGEYPPLPDFESIDLEVPRYYWRSHTYDFYFGRGWSTSHTEEVNLEAGEDLVSRERPYHRVLRQQVRVIGELGGIVYVTGQLASVDQDYEVSWRAPRDMFAATTEAVDYRADSLVPEYTAEDLRETGTAYPEWVMARYLQLPEEVPERVLALARDLTATEPTPYDRALAIEAYLRTFPYNLDVPTPRNQDDIADYFLFELQEGYCDYYATAMVVLARAAGLPARMVVGYVYGSYDPMNARYIVTEADAHAWVEVYFPRYGWIEFEPTGGRPPIDRGTEEEPIIWPEGADLDPLVDRDARREPLTLSLGLIVLIGVGAVLLVVFGATGVDSALLLLRRSPEVTVSRLYRRLQSHARRLRVRTREGGTPYELAQALVTRLKEIGQDREAEALLAPASDEVRALVDLYVRAWYAPRPVGAEEKRAAVWVWWKLRWRLALARLWRGGQRERAPMPKTPPRPEPDALGQHPA